jgi:hypothetical protein
MATKPLVITVRIDAGLRQAMENYQARYGAPLSEQVRRALQGWLADQDVMTKAERKRADTRKRP